MPTCLSDRDCTLRRLAAVIGVAAAAIVAASAAARRDWTAAPSKNFPLTGGNYWHQRYSTLDQINTSNIKKLGGAWVTRLEEGGRGGQLEGTPVVVDGVMYVTTGTRNALAIDAGTGKVKWRYRPDSEGPTGGNKGVVVAEGKVFFGRRDNVLVALDQETGALVWQTRLTSEPGASVSAPAVYDDGLATPGCGSMGRPIGTRISPTKAGVAATICSPRQSWRSI